MPRVSTQVKPNWIGGSKCSSGVPDWILGANEHLHLGLLFKSNSKLSMRRAHNSSLVPEHCRSAIEKIKANLQANR
jgi:hypothetical protein